MTQYNPVFNVSEFELRDYTNPYLTPDQEADVTLVKDRVNGQLDFLAQMLGWNGPNYWSNLVTTVDQKRQMLGGSFGVYDSFIYPTVIQIQNWDNKILIEPLPQIAEEKSRKGAKIYVGDRQFDLQGVERVGEGLLVSIGELDDQFFEDIASGEQIKVAVPGFRPAPFYRPEIGISGDASFVCQVVGEELTLYPSYDTQFQFPYTIPVLYADAVYYFDKPVYLALTDALEPEAKPQYDADRDLWYLHIPEGISGDAGLEAYLAVSQTGATQDANARLEVKLQSWSNPSDWDSTSVIENFLGTWGNKGGDLPFNFVFDSLSLHGCKEDTSVVLNEVKRNLKFNDIINNIYYGKVQITPTVPGGAKEGDLWWNQETGVLAVWLTNSGVGNWVQINYRDAPNLPFVPDVEYADVTEFRAGQAGLTPGTVVRISDIQGLDLSDEVIGVQGTLNSKGWVILHKEPGSPYWTPDEFGYRNVAEFTEDALLLPFKVPVNLFNADTLSPDGGGSFKITNLPITIQGNYDLLMVKYYENETWEIYPDSVLKYIAYSTLFDSPQQGQMWWDYTNSFTNLRGALIYYENAYVGLNIKPLLGFPSGTPFNMGVILFHCNGDLLTVGVPYVHDNFFLVYNENTTTGEYEFTYTPRNFQGSVQLPVIEISDNLTTVYREDISDFLFSGLTYSLSPSVANSESPLRLWKSQAMQVAETTDLLDQDVYINPLLADVNTGPGPENWEKYFIRMPLEYERNGPEWQKVALTCRDFAYWGSTIEPEAMRCPPEDDEPVIYEELLLYRNEVPDYTYVYSEPYLYSNLGYKDEGFYGTYANSGIYPTMEIEYDEFTEADVMNYDPLHNRTALTDSKTLKAQQEEYNKGMLDALIRGDQKAYYEISLQERYVRNKVFGSWEGVYINVNPSSRFSGYLVTDVENNAFSDVVAPVWDASIYLYPPTCENETSTYTVDANHYKIGYAYFVADASAAEDTFFDITQEAAWRYPETQPKTSYLVPR